MKLRSSLLTLLLFPLIAVAQSGTSYQCTLGDLSRRVVVERTGAAPVPCEVAYYKDSEAPGQRQSLWRAENDAGYCGARATEFVSKLEGLGWACSAGTAGGAAARNENETD